VQAADRSAEVVARAMIRGRGGRDEKPSFEMEGIVASARLDAEEGHIFGAAHLLVLSDNFPHVAISVKSYLLHHI
jgi:hypothetical protein